MENQEVIVQQPSVSNLVCPFCQFPISEVFLFCPNCGKKIKDAKITIGKQIGIYLLSIFLPPLGLWPGIKYLLRNDKKAKIVGMVAIILTILSAVIMIWYSVNLFSQLTKSINSSVGQYQNLGF
ncbi:MAG: zinc ribbon domain-containing protein [Candidatus Levyibacteriota bacterium]